MCFLKADVVQLPVSHFWEIRDNEWLGSKLWVSYNKKKREFLGHPVVRTPCSHCQGARFVPGQGIKIWAKRCGLKNKKGEKLFRCSIAVHTQSLRPV